MAEKKKTQTKAEEPARPTYEQLMEAANRMHAELMDKRRVEMLNEVGVRLQYLFKVVENKDSFPGDYVIGCVEDIMRILPCGEQEEQSEKQ